MESDPKQFLDLSPQRVQYGGMETTQRLIASADTTAGFAIGIVCKIAYQSGNPYFEVVRMNRHSQYVTISRHNDEATARAAANREYRADLKAA